MNGIGITPRQSEFLAAVHAAEIGHATLSTLKLSWSEDERREVAFKLRRAKLVREVAPLVLLTEEGARHAARCASEQVQVAGQTLRAPATATPKPEPAPEVAPAFEATKAEDQQSKTAQAWTLIRADLAEHPGSTTREISERTGVNGQMVGQVLAGKLRYNLKHVTQDRTAKPHRWSLASPSKHVPDAAAEAAAWEALWAALQPGPEHAGANVHRLAEMVVERLHALESTRRDVHEVLDLAGAPTAPTTVNRVRWLHGEAVASENRARHVAATELREALGVGFDVPWARLLTLARDRSRPLHLQLTDAALTSRTRATILDAAASELRGDA